MGTARLTPGFDTSKSGIILNVLQPLMNNSSRVNNTPKFYK